MASALVLGGALANCASEEASDDEVLGEDDITGVNNSFGLRLVYEAESQTVRATMKRKLRAGEKLLLRVRRGRLSIESQRELDCTGLPEAPALPPTEEGPQKVVYQGPHVDASLLASVYNETWVRGNITPRMLDMLEREGADSIVEACILRTTGNVRARLQTSLAYAWDEADPNLAASSTGGRSVHFLAGDAGAADDDQPIQSMEKYAERCVEELGEIPFFVKKKKGDYATFDCRDFVGEDGQPVPGVEGALIPQSVTGADGRDATPAECDARDPSRYNCFSKCDRPEWLFQSCEPGPTVSTATNAQGTHWTLLCRSAGERGEKNVGALLSTKRFNDIAMIGHDPKTGKSCFFQNKIFDGTDGARVTHPADVEKSRHIWDAPKGYCMRCHSAEAFIHSPWIDGAKRKDGTPIVPMMGKHPDFPISRIDSPFSIVHREAQARAFVGGSSWELPKHLVSEGADACLTCHRIGGGDGMRRFPMWAVGEEGLDTSASGTSGPLLPKLTDDAKSFEKAHWMPLRLEGLDAQSWPSSSYAKAVAQIRACADDPQADGCEWADVPSR